ncbi:putative C-type lectin domain family 20 member A isoform X2 [Xyrauchen texanus]|uniref:putative C-type lectin domain family 20 member A isoform X2 n=1 Tax=Xyrauchen texanus TaxID=154827 RepID=UPI0022420AC1|nr:putative C-type lectin domain family 20 member A isoform X2 [Xyrauchen texanus]
MEHKMIRLFLFSAFLSAVPCSSHEYVLIQEYKTWKDAQAYCRKNYSDLATVQTDEDGNKINKLSIDREAYSWIGLYADVNSWRWSFNDENVTFLKWDYDQPNNLGGKQYCTALQANGYWWDEYCDFRCGVLCKSEGPNVVLVTDPLMTWFEAQSYCRENYIDLLTVKTKEENQQLTSMIQKYPCAWIGLFRDSWKWSDQTSTTLSSLGWEFSEPNNMLGNENCTAINYDGQIADKMCSRQFFFFCNVVKVTQQILRLEVKAGDNVSEQAIKTAVLNKIKQELGEKGTSEDFNITWREQTNGMVFQKLENGSSTIKDEL